MTSSDDIPDNNLLESIFERKFNDFIRWLNDEIATCGTLTEEERGRRTGLEEARAKAYDSFEMVDELDTE